MADEFLSTLPDKSVGAVITDPPFHVSTGRPPSGHAKAGFGQDPWTSDQRDNREGRRAGDPVGSISDVIEWTRPHVVQCARVIRPGGALVVMGGTQSLVGWDTLTSYYGLQWMAELIVLWNTGKPRQRNFGSIFTRVVWYCKAGLRHSFNHHKKSIYSNVLICTKIPPASRRHPSEKPVGLTNFLVSLLTDSSDLVVDPFCGSGTTLISAEMCERRWLGCDMDAAHVRTARLRTMTADSEEVDPVFLWVNGRLEEV